MSQSNFSILVKAIQNVTQNPEFRNCWVNQSSLIKAMSGRFMFHSELKVQSNTKAILTLFPNSDDVTKKY